MDIKELLEAAKTDCKIDVGNLHVEAARTPDVYNKYLKMLYPAKFLLKKAKAEYSVTYLAKVKYYTGKADPEEYKKKPFPLKVLRQDVDMYLQADDELQQAEAKVTYAEEKVDCIEKILKTISDRQWNVRNAIESLKLQNGII